MSKEKGIGQSKENTTVYGSALWSMLYIGQSWSFLRDRSLCMTLHLDLTLFLSLTLSVLWVLGLLIYTQLDWIWMLDFGFDCLSIHLTANRSPLRLKVSYVSTLLVLGTSLKIISVLDLQTFFWRTVTYLSSSYFREGDWGLSQGSQSVAKYTIWLSTLVTNIHKIGRKLQQLDEGVLLSQSHSWSSSSWP